VVANSHPIPSEWNRDRKNQFKRYRRGFGVERSVIIIKYDIRIPGHAADRPSPLFNLELKVFYLNVGFLLKAHHPIVDKERLNAVTYPFKDHLLKSNPNAPPDRR
jgi:hypothetical protein